MAVGHRPGRTCFLSLNYFRVFLDFIQVYKRYFLLLTEENILLMYSSTKGKRNGKTSKKRKTCSSTNSDTSREISAHSAHNRSLLNVAIGDEILSEAISKANDVLYVVHCDDSN